MEYCPSAARHGCRWSILILSVCRVSLLWVVSTPMKQWHSVRQSRRRWKWNNSQDQRQRTTSSQAEKKTTDVIAHSLGMIAESADRSRYTNSVLIRKNLAIPSAQTRPYQMAVRPRGDTQLEVFLTQGESDDPEQCVYLGRYVFSDFPPATAK